MPSAPKWQHRWSLINSACSPIIRFFSRKRIFAQFIRLAS
jgi:hypothetical protein